MRVSVRHKPANAVTSQRARPARMSPETPCAVPHRRAIRPRIRLKANHGVRTACCRTRPNQEKAHEPDHLHRRRHRYRPVHTGILRTPIGPAASPRRVCLQRCRAAEQSAGHSGEQPQAAIRQKGCAIRHGRLRARKTLIHSHVRLRQPTHASSALPETPLCMSTLYVYARTGGVCVLACSKGTRRCRSSSHRASRAQWRLCFSVTRLILRSCGWSSSTSGNR